MRTVGYLLAAALAALAIAGCGSSSEDTASTPTGLGPPGSATTSTAPSGIHTKACVDEDLDPPEILVIGGNCAEGKRTVAAWTGKRSCSSPPGASRYACTVGKLRCVAASTDRGLAVSCSRPNLSISFIAKRG